MDSADQKYTLISRNLQEVLGQDQIQRILQERELRIYWGTAPTGRIHVGYFVPIIKIADFLAAGCSVTVLIADIHAYLDSEKSSLEQLQHRSRYYEEMVKKMLCAVGVGTENIRFVLGSSFQKSAEYTVDVYRLASKTTVHDTQKAGSETVKQSGNPRLSSLLYPGMQALDEQYLQVDAQFGGVDQRKIFTYAEKMLPQLGYSKRSHLMNGMVPGLQGDKMSSSEEKSKIDILDTEEVVQRKIKKAFCEEKKVEGNTVLLFVQKVVYPVLGHQNKTGFTVARKEEHGGPVTFASYAELEQAFVQGTVHPLDLKAALATQLNEILSPIRREFADEEHATLLAQAYD